MSEEDVWIYHERQEALLCGQHALNNLVQAAVFTADALAEIARQLDAMELNYMAQNDEGGINSKDYLKRVSEGSSNVDPSGNFSIEVLRSALMNQYSLSLPNIRQEGVRDKEVTELEGFICNRSSHWFAIRKIFGRYWNLNSTQERPTLISHFHLATEIESLQMQGYSVFCIVEQRLPPPCTSKEQRRRGLPQYWWKEEDLVKGKTNATTGATDPWKSVGQGMRLDGKQPSSAKTTSHHQPIVIHDDDDDMDDDAMLQMALEASLKDDSNTKNSNSNNDNNNISSSIISSAATPAPVVAVPPEPPAGKGPDNTVARIQFRLPNGQKVIRRFLKTERIEVVYAFVKETCPPSEGGGGQQRRRLELKAGFPPKDIGNEGFSKTVGEAGLHGDTMQCRYV